MAPLSAAEHPHEHGVGRLDVARDGTRLTLRLTAPADTFVGFERAPASDQERDAVREAHALLADGAALFGFDPAARCAAVKDDGAKRDSHGHDHASADAADDHDHEDHDHADWHVDHAFACATPSALRRIDLHAFTRFPRFERIEVQYIGDDGQAAAMLTPAATVLELP